MNRTTTTTTTLATTTPDVRKHFQRPDPGFSSEVIAAMQGLALLEHALVNLSDDANESEMLIRPVSEASRLLEIVYDRFLSTLRGVDASAVAYGDARVRVVTREEHVTREDLASKAMAFGEAAMRLRLVKAKEVPPPSSPPRRKVTTGRARRPRAGNGA